jgi:hypothetical protein
LDAFFRRQNLFYQKHMPPAIAKIGSVLNVCWCYARRRQGSQTRLGEKRATSLSAISITKS